MKIVGLCKALTCADFLPAVLDGIYDQLDQIVFLYPQKAWDGAEVVNEVKPFVRQWRRINDYAFKIVEMETDHIKQSLQYTYTINQIINTMHPDWILLFDTDEVWDSKQLKKLIEIALENDIVNAIHTGMRTYIKSPLYRIDPAEPCRPCVLVRAIPGICQGVRGNQTFPRYVAEDIYFHHFSYVRTTEEEVFRKARLSTLSDGLQLVDMDQWKKEKWDMLPSVHNFHTTLGAEKCWQNVKVIDEKILPAAVRELSIYKQLVGGSDE